MPLCMNSRCNGTDYLCGKCRKLYPNLAASLDQGRRNNRKNNRGSILYGRNYGSTRTPSGASGDVNLRTGEGHATQYYDDKYRYSWDTDGKGESRNHWTNQNVGRKNHGRHDPPSHAK